MTDISVLNAAQHNFWHKLNFDDENIVLFHFFFFLLFKGAIFIEEYDVFGSMKSLSCVEFEITLFGRCFRKKNVDRIFLSLWM